MVRNCCCSAVAGNPGVVRGLFARSTLWRGWMAVAFFVPVVGQGVARGEPAEAASGRRPVVAGLRVVGVRRPAALSTESSHAVVQGETAVGIPVSGFSPYIAIALTNQRRGELELAHVVSNTVVGPPLASPMSERYAIGILDTGATTNLIGQCDRARTGLDETRLTGNRVPIGGAGCQVDADVTDPLGVWMAGLGAIDPVTLALDTAALAGHWNVSLVTIPEASCGDLVDVQSVVGTPLLAFRDFVIRTDLTWTIVRDGVTYVSPDVRIYPPGDARVPEYRIEIPLDVRPAGMTISAYYPDLTDFDRFEHPSIPTALALMELAPPTGGWFFASVRMSEGAGGEISKMLMVDTGAQVSVIRSFVAGQLGLNPDFPEFTVEVANVCGEVAEAPGFYVDVFKIDAFGGPLTLRQVPVIVMDLPSVEGGTLDGVIGMNVFFDRNLTFRPRLTGSSVLSVRWWYGDLDRDRDVDLNDFATFQVCFNGSGRPPVSPSLCGEADSDQDGDVDVNDFAVFQICFNGAGQSPTDACPQG